MLRVHILREETGETSPGLDWISPESRIRSDMKMLQVWDIRVRRDVRNNERRMVLKELNSDDAISLYHLIWCLVMIMFTKRRWRRNTMKQDKYDDETQWHSWCYAQVSKYYGSLITTLILPAYINSSLYVAGLQHVYNPCLIPLSHGFLMQPNVLTIFHTCRCNCFEVVKITSFKYVIISIRQ